MGPGARLAGSRCPRYVHSTAILHADIVGHIVTTCRTGRKDRVLQTGCRAETIVLAQIQAHCRVPYYRNLRGRCIPGRAGRCLGHDEEADKQRAPKRRKLDEKARKAAMENLLGSYGSGDSDRNNRRMPIAVLGEYARATRSKTD